MAKAQSLEAKLDELEMVAQTPDSPEARKCFRAALRGRKGPLAAAAARAIGKANLPEWIDELETAFPRFCRDGLKIDKGCRAKKAILHTLNDLEAASDDLFLEASRVVQLEPVYGGREDTACECRVRGAEALVRRNHPDAMRVVCRLLFDAAVEARRGAISVCGYAGNAPAELLLRAKIHAGDEDASILGDALKVLMQIAPGTNLEFVAAYLEAENSEVRELAALALGESKDPQAFVHLRSAWETSYSDDLQRDLILPIAMCRCEQAVDLLLEESEDAPPALLGDYIDALELYRDDAQVGEAVRERLEELSSLR